jgi:hypothetical protein
VMAQVGASVMLSHECRCPLGQTGPSTTTKASESALSFLPVLTPHLGPLLSPHYQLYLATLVTPLEGQWSCSGK